MFHRITLSPLLILLPLLHATVVGADTSHMLRVDTVTRDVRLSLIVPRSVYPREVLTLVTVRVQNLSRQRLGILPGFTDRNCAIDNPQVQSLSPGGILRYPPAVRIINPGPMQPCVGGGAFGLSSYAPLAPGASREGNVLVVLGASRLRAMVALAPVGRNNRALGRPLTVVGPTVQVRLVQAAMPRIVPCSTTYTCLRVLPPTAARVSGSLYYAYSALCADAKGNVAYQQDARFEVTGNSTLHIGCNATFRELHVVAAWLNQPVGRLDWVSAPGAASVASSLAPRTAAEAARSHVTDLGSIPVPG